MRMMQMCLWACFCVCMSGLAAPRARACSRPRPGLFAVSLIAGVPDAQGNLNGQPNPNVLSEGDAIVLIGDCGDCLSDTQTVSLTDAANQTRAATLEPIHPGDFWRLRPQQPLASGQYRLKLLYTGPGADSIGEGMTYVFNVHGLPIATPLEHQIGLSSYLDRSSSPSGTQFTCKEIASSCGGANEVWTQRHPRVDIVATPTREPTVSERQAFLYRLVPSDDPNAADLMRWNIAADPSGPELFVSSIEQKPQYCVELQALRTTDLTTVSVAKRCFSHTLPSPPFEPMPFNTLCTTDQPEACARAWCTDNQAACSESNPRAAQDDVRLACIAYPALCAAFLGNRAQDMLCQ